MNADAQQRAVFCLVVIVAAILTALGQLDGGAFLAVVTGSGITAAVPGSIFGRRQ